MTRNIEILGYISQNPGSNTRDVADYFGVTINRASKTLGDWWRYRTVKRDYSIDKGYIYYLTKWGKRYLEDQWEKKMGDVDITKYSSSYAQIKLLRDLRRGGAPF